MVVQVDVGNRHKHINLGAEGDSGCVRAQPGQYVRYRLSSFSLGHSCEAAVVHLAPDWAKAAIREAPSNLRRGHTPQDGVHEVSALSIKCPQTMSPAMAVEVATAAEACRDLREHLGTRGHAHAVS